jgi:hypothetical protein
MTVELIKQTTDTLTIQITFQFNRSMLDSEGHIQNKLNEAGTLATGELLKQFDTDGSSLTIGSERFTSKGLFTKCYQTPYGDVEVQRHLYQTSKGGETFCPLEREARIILTSTPRLASQISHKMANATAVGVVEDLNINHHRTLSKNVVQRLCDAVASVVEVKEESWSYQVPEIQETEIKSIGIGLDGTCMLMCEGAYRQAMVGTIALYDGDGERQHTTYIAAAPEYGKEAFKARLTREIERTKTLYPEARRIGIADGAHDNWEFLERHTQDQVLDFYHATEYLSKVATCLFSEAIERKAWLDDRCHELKHTPGSASAILSEMERFKTAIAAKEPVSWSLSNAKKIKGIVSNQLLEKAKERAQADSPENASKTKKEKLDTLSVSITYFTNNIGKSRMNYAEHVALNHVIGSGVTEAACKTIVKQRLCQSGMRWKDKGAKGILSLRALVKSSGRWGQFWNKINQWGFPISL